MYIHIYIYIYYDCGDLLHKYNLNFYRIPIIYMSYFYDPQ